MEIMVTMEQFIESIKYAKDLIVTAESFGDSNPICNLYINGAHLDAYEYEGNYLRLEFVGNGNVKFETYEFHGIETEDFDTELHYHLTLDDTCKATIYLTK